MERLNPIRSRFDLQIDIRIGHFIAYGPVADHEEDSISFGDVQEMVAIAGAGREPDAGGWSDGLAIRVRHKYQLAF